MRPHAPDQQRVEPEVGALVVHQDLGERLDVLQLLRLGQAGRDVDVRVRDGHLGEVPGVRWGR